MDDINQKENQVRLSVQSMEHRISNLEDLGEELSPPITIHASHRSGYLMFQKALKDPCTVSPPARSHQLHPTLHLPSVFLMMTSSSASSPSSLSLKTVSHFTAIPQSFGAQL